MDHFTPDDFAMLSDCTYAWLAALLNAVEAGAPWPRDLANGRAAYLSKDASNIHNPLAYRVMLILQVLYRRWATCRLHDMQQGVQMWQKTNMYAGVEGSGAEEGWYTTALSLEKFQLDNTNFAGSCADIYKCFDQISRPLLYHLAKVAGMPTNILNTYMRFQEQLTIYNTLALGIGWPHKRPCGIPQGCPLSMMLVSRMLRPWMSVMEEQNAIARTLSDDMMVITVGSNHLHDIINITEQTHRSCPTWEPA